MNLENNIQNVLNDKLSDGTLENMIEKELEKSMQKVISDLFGPWGDISDIMKKKVKSVMVPFVENFNYDEYLVKLDTVVTEILNEVTIDNKTILTNFKDLIKHKEIEKLTVTEIFDMWSEFVAEEINTSNLEVLFYDDVYYENPEIEMEVIEDSSYSWSSFHHAKILLTCDKDEEMNQEIRLIRYKNEDWTITGRELGNISSLRYLDKFSVFLFNLSQSKTKIIIDEYNMSDEVEVEAEPEPDFR